MYILDTDHLSVLDRGGIGAQNLSRKLATVDPSQVGTTIINYEEQTRGWLSYMGKARSIEQQVDSYRQLKQQLLNYCTIPVLDFDRAAGEKFQLLKKLYPRLGNMDMKIAAIALANKAIVLTRNERDFGQIEDLSIENWTQ
jgi:tRNA(fMet)-specific endonuclease VapC